MRDASLSSRWTLSSYSSSLPEDEENVTTAGQTAEAPLPQKSSLPTISNGNLRPTVVAGSPSGPDRPTRRPTAMNALSERLNRAIHRFYRRWAVFVSRHCLAIIAFCVIASAVGIAKMATTKRRNDIRGYTPYGSRSLHEFDVRDEFFAQNGTGIRFIAIIVPRNMTPISVQRASDGSSYIVQDEDSGGGSGNLLDLEALAEIVKVDDKIRNDLPIFNRLTGRNESFAQICRLFCDVNNPVRAFYSGLRDQTERLARGVPLSGRVNLSYPVANVFGFKANLLPNFFDVKLRTDQVQRRSERQRTNPARIPVTNIERLGMVVLLYRAERIGGWTDEDIFDYEMSIHAHFKRHELGSQIRVLTISSSYVAQEVDRAGETLRPYVMIGLGVMIACAVATCSLSAVYARQMSIHKVTLAVFACICPFLASGTALGWLFYCGMRHSSILSVTPFLILALGVDDAFLTIHAWQNVCAAASGGGGFALMRHRQMPSIESRLAIVLEETGPAILISALTNILADVVGSFTGSPEITLLCVANIASIVVDFFYQITFFTAVLILVARMEETGSLRHPQPYSDDSLPSLPDAVVQTTVPAISLCGTVFDACHNDKNNKRQQQQIVEDAERGALAMGSDALMRLRARFVAVVDAYIRGVTNVAVAAGVCAAWAVFLAFCLQAMLSFEINLTTHKLFVGDSPLLEMETYREERILPSYTMAQIFVNRPGNLSDGVRRARLDRLVAEMEALPNAIGREQGGTRYFMRDFVAFEESYGNVDDESSQSSKFSDGPAVMDSDQVARSGSMASATPTVFTSMDSLGRSNRTRSTSSAFLATRPKRTELSHRRTAREIVAILSRPTEEVDVNVEADLKAFLEWPEYRFWRTFLKFYPTDPTSGRLTLDSIMIVVGFRGAELRDWYKRARMLGEWRRVIDAFGADFNASVLHDEGLYLDLLENMTTDIWQSLVGTLVCMAGICALFMNSRFVVSVAISVIASIMTSTLGIMAMQRMTIDPVVMAAVIISLGFSVDIPTHISYHFHVSGKPPHLHGVCNNNQADPQHEQQQIRPNDNKHKNNSNENNKQNEVEEAAPRISCERRIRSAFNSVGFPAIQASICMNICILCFLLVPVYIAQVFIRVMCLCSVLCALHSFVLLPALFTVVDALSSAFADCWRRRWHHRSDKIAPMK